MSEKVKILIVEDEFITLDNLRETLRGLGYAISGTAMKAEQAISILEEGETDFAILDINLKGRKDGIWIGEQIQNKYRIPFIFLTAFADPETVKRAAAVQPSSYLVKPFTQPSVFAAIEVVLSSINISRNFDKDNPLSQYIFIKEDKVYKKIFLSDIRYIEAFKNYLEINLKSGRHIIRSTLKDFMEQLPSQYFIQTHRSFVVNKSFIESVSSESIILTSRKIPISKTFQKHLMGKLLDPPDA